MWISWSAVILNQSHIFCWYRKQAKSEMQKHCGDSICPKRKEMSSGISKAMSKPSVLSPAQFQNLAFSNWNTTYSYSSPHWTFTVVKGQMKIICFSFISAVSLWDDCLLIFFFPVPFVGLEAYCIQWSLVPFLLCVVSVARCNCSSCATFEKWCLTRI